MEQKQVQHTFKDSRLHYLENCDEIITEFIIQEIKEIGEIPYLIKCGMERLEMEFWNRPNWNQTEIAVYGRSYVIELESTPIGYKAENDREFWRVIITAPFDAKKAVKCSNPYKLNVGEWVYAVEYDSDGTFHHPTRHSRYATSYDGLCNGCRYIQSFD